MFIEYRGKVPKVACSAFVAPTAVLIGDVEVGEEASIWFGVVLRADNGPIRIGARSNIQDNAVLHVSEGSETIVGADVTIGHCAHMEDCVIEDQALIGSNAEVLAAGTPAVVKKPLGEKAAEWIEMAALEYVRLSRSYLHQGIGDPEVHEIAVP